MKFIKSNKKALIIWLVLIFAFGIAAVLAGGGESSESLQEMMRDAVLHEEGKAVFFGLVVNPAFISAVTVTVIMLVAAVLLRVLLVPKFTTVPGKAQLVLETVVGYFEGLGRSNSPHKNKILGGYLFAAGTYVAISTLFELLGLQITTTEGMSMSMPAALADINADIAMGVLSYLFIMSGGIAVNGAKGVALTLKEFSLPISMSFRLFGSLLSGLLVTELIYYSIYLSFVLPVAVAVLFTLLHAVIQAYVLTMLVAIFYGEVSEPSVKKEKKDKKGKKKAEAKAALS